MPSSFRKFQGKYDTVIQLPVNYEYYVPRKRILQCGWYGFVGYDILKTSWSPFALQQNSLD